MSVYFAHPEEEFPLDLDWYKDAMRSLGHTSITVYKGQPYRDDQHIWCKEYQAATERGWCGKQCGAYLPRNGRSGACKHLGHFYEPINEPITIPL
jgi:hypothetical protein